MGKPQTVVKRQREMARRERQQQKAEKRAQRKNEVMKDSDIETEVVRETPIVD